MREPEPLRSEPGDGTRRDLEPEREERRVVEPARQPGAERTDAGVAGPGRVHHAGEGGRPPEARGMGARDQREPIRAALLDDALAAAAERRQGRLVVEPRQEEPRLLPARREEVDPSDQLQQSLPFGGGEDLAGVDDHARPTRPRPRDLARQRVARHRRQHHHRPDSHREESGGVSARVAACHSSRP